MNVDKNFSRLLICLTLISTSAAFAQQLPDREREAEKDYQNKEYALAANLYASLLRSWENPHDVGRIADCYRRTKNFANAEKWYAREMQLQPTNGIERFYYGEMLLENGKFKDAQEQTQLFQPASAQQKKMKEARIASFANTSSLTNHNSGFTIRNARGLNSPYSDFGAAITSDKMIFVSNRPLSKHVLKENPAYRHIYGWTNEPFWKLFETHFSVLGNPVQPSLMSPVINSPFNNGPAVFNSSGTVIWFSKAEELRSRGKIVSLSKGKFIGHNGIYYAEKVNDTWSIPVAFPYNNLRNYSVSHPALSPDGKYLYFASDMPGGKGGVDLYYSVIKDNGHSFGKPVNLGDSINTFQDEEFPSFGPDSTLYFSCNGRQGLGGLDIFKAKGYGNHWTTPENLGAPVNSNRDDFSLIFRAGKPYYGYFSSNRDGGMGDDDIYSFDYMPVMSVKDSMRLASITHQKTTIAQDSLKTFFKLKSLDNLEGKTLQVPNIYYKTNRPDPDPSAFPILDRLVRLLQLFPDMEVEVRSHTDAVGKASANLKLSELRANWVKTYLVLHSIQIERLRAKGFGKSHMIARCGIKKPCTAKENRINRRTELQILKQ